MPTPFETYSSWALSTLVFALVFGLRTRIKDEIYRRDLRGALNLLAAHLLFRGLAHLLPEEAPALLVKGTAVIWRLALAWGVLRALVGSGLSLLRKRGTNPPNILRNVIDASVYTLAAIPILKSQLDFDLTGVLATSAVISVVIGLALQDTLGNLFAGLSLQLDLPFATGDWVTIGPHTGHVVNFTWRATRIQKRTRELITLPNNLVAKESVRNHSRGGQKVAVDEHLQLAFEAPPNQARAILLETINACPLVLPEPAAFVRTEGFGDSAIRYWVRFWVAEYLDFEQVRDDFYSRLWYRLRREGLEFALPRRSVQMREAPPPVWPLEARLERLRGLEFFAHVDPESLTRLAAGVRVRDWGARERVVEEGEAGETFYVVARGNLVVRSGHTELGRLGPGDCFGEMSLLTGEARSATVEALEDVTLFEVDRSLFRNTLLAQPKLAEQLSILLAARQGAQRRAAGGNEDARQSSPEAGHIFTRLRQIFSL